MTLWHSDIQRLDNIMHEVICFKPTEPLQLIVSLNVSQCHLDS